MANELVYFRVDHGFGIGDGHLYRSKALASFLKNEGFKVVFVTRPRKGFDLKKFDSFEVVLLASLPLENKEWLGVTEEQDAEECFKLVRPIPESVWIVDHYGIEKNWEKNLKQKKQKIVVIDDLARAHNADIIIDQNITADQDKYKNQNTLNACSYLMGPKFSLLRQDISQAPYYQDNSEQNSYLLSLGSAPDDLFYKMLEVLRSFSFSHLDILNPPKNFKNFSNEHPIEYCANLPELYSRQRLVFGSCGVANIERMALAVPSVTVVIVDNQVEVGKKLLDLDLTFHLGDLREKTQEDLKKSIQEILEKPREVILKKALQSSKVISRNGIKQIVAVIKKAASRSS